MCRNHFVFIKRKNNHAGVHRCHVYWKNTNNILLAPSAEQKMDDSAFTSFHFLTKKPILAGSSPSNYHTKKTAKSMSLKGAQTSGELWLESPF